MNFRALTDDDRELVHTYLSNDYVEKWFGPADNRIQEIIQRKTKFSFIMHFIVEENGKTFAFCQY